MYLGIDLGTGSVKLMLADKSGNTHIASATYPIEASGSGFAETNPEKWIEAIRTALKKLPDITSVRGIGFSGQMHGIVPLDKAGRASLGHAILWADQRGRKYLDQFKEFDVGIQQRLLNAPVAGMAATTLLWLKHEQPATYAKIRSVLFPKDYIRYVMTGEKATDYSDASGSLLYDFRTRNWYGDVVSKLGLDFSYLPPIRAGIKRAGAISASGAKIFGLPQGIPVAIGGGDAPTGMFGNDLHLRNQIQISVGTAAQISRPIPVEQYPVWNPALNVFEGIRTTDRYRVAAMLNVGIALEWVCRILKRDWNEIYAALEGRDPSKEPDILFLPYLSGERTPYMNPDARGAWIGLGLHHTDMDLAFAALVGVACTIRLGLETLGTDGVDSIKAVGGSLQHEYWRNLLASVIGHPVTISRRTDISAYGATRIAAEMLNETIHEKSTHPETYSGFELPWIMEYYDRIKKGYALLSNL